MLLHHKVKGRDDRTGVILTILALEVPSQEFEQPDGQTAARNLRNAHNRALGVDNTEMAPSVMQGVWQPLASHDRFLVRLKYPRSHPNL